MTPLEQLARKHPGLGRGGSRPPSNPIQSSPMPKAVRDLSPVPFAWASESAGPMTQNEDQPIPRGPTTSEATSSTPTSFPSDAPTRRGIGDAPMPDQTKAGLAAAGTLGFGAGFFLGLGLGIAGMIVIAVSKSHEDEDERYRRAGYSGR